MSHAWSVLSLNVVRFVLKRGPFVLNVVHFVLAVVRFVRGPFCPWSVMSLIRVIYGHYLVYELGQVVVVGGCTGGLGINFLVACLCGGGGGGEGKGRKNYW